MVHSFYDIKYSLIQPTDTLSMLSEYCSEFLIHAADVEGLCKGIDEDLVKKLGEWVNIPTTYAGGAKREYTYVITISGS